MILELLDVECVTQERVTGVPLAYPATSDFVTLERVAIEGGAQPGKGAWRLLGFVPPLIVVLRCDPLTRRACPCRAQHLRFCCVEHEAA